MPICRERVLDLIDQALKCRARLDFCNCQVVGIEVMECDGCRIKKALWCARSCIIAINEKRDLLNVRFIGVQDAIEDKLAAYLGDHDLSEEGDISNE